MALAPKGSAPPIFDLKSANLSLVALLLKTADLGELREELERRFADAPQFFGNDPVLIDLAALGGEDVVLDFAGLLQLLRDNRIHPVAVRGGTPEQHAAALEAGLPEAADEGSAELVRPEPVVRTLVREVEREVIREVVREVPTTVPALIVDRPLRSGQQVYAKGGDLVVLAMVNFGAELIADGSIHVYAPLRGKAIAGARGNTEARIYVTALEPELLAIAGTYRTSENPLPDEVRGKAAQIRLEGDKLLIEPLEL